MIAVSLQASRPASVGYALLAALSLMVSLTAALAKPVPAAADVQAFRVTNTAVLTRTPDGVTATPGELDQRIVHISLCKTGENLLLDIGTRLKLWKIPDGLARIDWPQGTGTALSRDDAIALSGQATAADVPTWGAEVIWPDLGPVTLVLFETSPESYGGLLSSTPSGVPVLRQMMFQTLTPRSRPRAPGMPRSYPGVETLAD